MDKQQSKEFLSELLSSFSTDEVDKVLGRYNISDADWSNYGGRSKNWDTVSNQQSNAIGALTELITNSIDAVLSRKVYESGIKDLSSDEAPKSMHDAVRHCYNVSEGKLSSLETKERTKLAKESILIGVKRKTRRSTTPTITIVDFGEGQEPQKFKKTFLSLSENNKEGVGFVQGKFNMGSTGSIRFCTKSDITKGHYKLIISKRYDLKSSWGWTLIKVAQVEQGRELPIVKYLAPNGEIPSFESKSIRAFNDNEIGVIEQGSVIKLFDYDVGGKAHQVDFGLDNALTLNLLDCALPIRIYDFDAQINPEINRLRGRGIIDRTFTGMQVKLCDKPADISNQDPPLNSEKPNEETTEFIHLVSQYNDNEIGEIKIIAVGSSKHPIYLRESKKRIFYTINGQTHATENASFLNLKDVGLGELENHVVIDVQCERMDKTALSTIFMGNREKIADNRLSRQLKKIVKKNLKEDKKLKEYVNIIRARRVSKIIEEDEETKKLLEDYFNQDPAMRQLLGPGDTVFGESQTGRGPDPWEGGKQFPTFLKPLNIKTIDNSFFKELPINTFRKIICETDAANDYLIRNHSPGRIYLPNRPSQVNIKTSLNNGIATFTLSSSSKQPPNVGDKLSFDIGFDDDDIQRGKPLEFNLTIRFIEEQKTKKNPSGTSSSGVANKKDKSFADPTQWLYKENWDDYNFDEKSGAVVVAGVENNPTIYVNYHHEVLEKMRRQEKDEARRQLNETRFRICLGLLTFAIHKHYNENEEKAQEKSRGSSDAIAPCILSLIVRFGEGARL